MRTLTIIDTFGFFFRSFYALPPLRNSEGFPTSLLLGFANLIHTIYKEQTCDYLVFALEGGGINHRKKLDPNYKANRSPAPEELRLQLPIAIEWITKMGFENLSFEGYEADDAIASLTHWAKDQNMLVKIISHDKDLYQLIDDTTFLYDPIKKCEIRSQECISKWGISPEDFIHFQALIGDTSDNIPGIKGIGNKTAQKLINHYHTLEALYDDQEHLESLVTKRLATLIREGKEAAFRSRDLVTLRKDLIQSFTPTPFPKDNPLKCILPDLVRFDFERLILKVKGQSPFGFKKPFDQDYGQKKVQYSPKPFTYRYHLLTSLDEALKILQSHPIESRIAFDCETDGLNIQESQMVGFSFSLDGVDGYYVPFAHDYLGVNTQISKDEAKILIQEIFKHPIIGHNLKFDYLITKNNFDLLPQNLILDSMVLAWLEDSSSPVGLDRQMFKWFDHKMIAFEDVVSKGQHFGQIHLEDAAKYASEDAVATYQLFHFLEAKLKDIPHLLNLAHTLEFPLILTLAEMENQGIKIDIAFFEKLKNQVSQLISECSSKIYTLANEDFNLNSPQQLSNILFEKLKLKGSKQVKGGFSTEEKVLEKLINDHPIIPEILQYREAYKLRNTYIEPLLKLVDTQHKIFTSFLQTGTATGRLSSKSPNLQNIPVRSEAGRKIREGFIAQEGCVLLSVDYSQIELRLLAHFSQDPNLTQAFESHQDIHTQTALKIFGNSDDSKRAIAKSINFGLIYGMGAKKLSETLKIPLKDAKSYIESYFTSFPTVKTFLKTQEENILSQGYAQTLLGHRRYFNFDTATDFQKSNFLREGINTIFQGSAADLIKLAMNAIQQHIQNTPIKMLLQVHDELIFELPESGAREKGEEIATIMNSIYSLKVPLECGISIGRNWAELK
ncbi:DNA polymerase I [Helicobacter pametensis]|uniref:DNA polymerase I n=1 Tax=Helicobacter pametensis TaxID=95149 RepID=UPI000485FAA4|nr:DNA polymerase I [Helicobacter pametensis]